MYDNVLHYIDHKAEVAKQCIETYRDKFGGVSNATLVAIHRSIESDCVKQFSLHDCRAVRNQIRMYIMDKTCECQTT